MSVYRLKNYFSAFVLIFTVFFVTAQQLPERKSEKKNAEFIAKGGPVIEVNNPSHPASGYTPTQLVTNVLISSGSNCGAPQISNVSISPNQPTTNADRFWGYFKKGPSNFPFQDGIVLTSGFARRAGNTTETSTISNINGGGADPDLIAALNTNLPINDSGVLEFDFVPTSTQMKFNYIFASEEYDGSYPCPPTSYDDAFVLLLKPNTPGSTYTNLAVLPGGAGPVSVPNIIPATISCGPVNAQYFGGLTNNGTNYNGRTTPLTAIATVVPGQSYHIKMVIADARDSSWDSAVFLEAGSFDIGVQILGPTGVALPSSINMCDNTPQTLTSSVQTAGATFQWTLNGTPIAGATNPTYIATQPGVYCLQVTIPGNQCPGEACVTIVGGTSPTVQNTTLTQCYGAGNVNFNLTLAQPTISSTPGVTYTYYITQADALAGTSPITTPTAFSSAGGQTLYVAVKSGFCTKIAELQLVKAPQMTATIAQPVAITCLVPQIALNATGSTYPAGATFNWVATNGGYIVSGTNTLTPIVNNSGTYTLTITKSYQPGDTHCTATASVVVEKNTTPPVATLTVDKNKVCAGEPVTLTASGGVSYVWVSNAATGNTVMVSPSVTTTYQVYAIGPNGCQSLTPASVTVNVVPQIQSLLRDISGHICLGDQITLDAGPGTNYTYLWSTGATTRTITVATPGTYTVTINNGTCSKTFTTQVHLSPLPAITNVDFQNHTLTLTASNPTNGVLEYSINGGTTWQTSNVFNNVANNEVIKIHVRTKNTSCQSISEYFTFFASNFITPNGDGYNDVLDLTAISNYPNFAANISDRYGKLVWTATKQQPIWDGRFQGRLLPTTSYWYHISYQDPTTKQLIQRSGWILLKNRE